MASDLKETGSQNDSVIHVIQISAQWVSLYESVFGYDLLTLLLQSVGRKKAAVQLCWETYESLCVTLWKLLSVNVIQLSGDS